MPTYLFSKKAGVIKKLAGSFPYIFLDYDGTLAPIVKNPYEAAMPEAVTEVLRLLLRSGACKAAIISGRSLKDIKRRAAIPGMVYAGNHGFEIKGPNFNFTRARPKRYIRALKKISPALKKALAFFKGVIIEDKKFSLSVHYRNVNAGEIPLLRRLVYKILSDHLGRGDVKAKPGKMVLEVRPALDWDKGKVVLWLLAKARSASHDKARKIVPIYVGDDITDEDAFHALKKRGVTVRIGSSAGTQASYYIKNTRQVERLLRMISTFVKDRRR